MAYLTGIQTIQELKEQYRQLAKIHHPDNGGNPEIMKQLNAEYTQQHKHIESLQKDINPDYQTSSDADISTYMNIIQKLIPCHNITIEICGKWLWVSGNTKEIKDILKSLGLRYAPKKQMWYWHTSDYKKTHHKEFSIDQIRSKYGSQTISTKKEEQEKIYQRA